MPAEEIRTEFTVTMTEDGVVTKTRTFTGTFSVLLVRLQTQSPGCIVEISEYLTGSQGRTWRRMAKLTRTDSNRTITLS